VDVALAHQAGDAPAVHLSPPAPQFGMHSRDTVGVAGGDVQHGDLVRECVVGRLAGGLALAPSVVEGAGHVQYTAQQNDRIVRLLRMDQPVQRVHRSLSFAKKAVAFFTMAYQGAGPLIRTACPRATSCRRPIAVTSPTSSIPARTTLMREGQQGLAVGRQAPPPAPREASTAPAALCNEPPYTPVQGSRSCALLQVWLSMNTERFSGGGA
jgi:hypothetical protein